MRRFSSAMALTVASATALSGWVQEPAANGADARTIAVVAAAARAVPNGGPGGVAMTGMRTLWSVVLAALGTGVFATLAGRTAAGVET